MPRQAAPNTTQVVMLIVCGDALVAVVAEHQPQRAEVRAREALKLQNHVKASGDQR